VERISVGSVPFFFAMIFALTCKTRVSENFIKMMLKRGRIVPDFG
jgi:hypothetical protein